MMIMIMMISKYDDDDDDDEIKIWWCWLFCSIVTSAHKGISSTVILELREIFCQNLFISKHLNTSLHNLLKTGTFYDVHVMSCCVMIMNQCWKKEEKQVWIYQWFLRRLFTNYWWSVYWTGLRVKRGSCFKNKEYDFTSDWIFSAQMRRVLSLPL